MERPKFEDFDKICRLCLKSASLVNIFDRNPKTQQESLSTLVRETVEMLGLSIAPSDPYPRKICQVCKDFLRALHKFRQQAQEANDLVMEACPDADQEMASPGPAPRLPPLVLPRPQIPSTSAAVAGRNGVVKNEPRNVSQKAPSPRATRRSSQDKPYKQARAVEPVRKTYACHLCDFKGFSPKALSTHMGQHHPSRLRCKICGQQFIHELGLIMHEFEVHDIRVRLRGS